MERDTTDRDALRSKIEEGSTRMTESSGKAEKFQELIIEENKNLNQVINEKDDIIAKRDQRIAELEE